MVNEFSFRLYAPPGSVKLSSGSSSGDSKGGLRRSTIAVFSKLPPGSRRFVLHALGKYAPWEEGFDHTPPSPEPGEVAATPDFVGIGTQKAGTTWWHEAICSHPGVYARPDIHKERHYFDRYAIRPFAREDSERYQGWFPRPPGRLAGEWTPDYLDMPWVPDLMSRAAPQAKLLVILRDPVERISSGLAHVRRAVGTVTPDDYRDAVTRGFYHEALSWWLSHFPREQILVLQYERCRIDPVGQIQRTYEFLGLDRFIPPALQVKINPSTQVQKLDQEARRRLTELYRPGVHALCDRFPDIELGLWPNFH
jgi:hypothetical protein